MKKKILGAITVLVIVVMAAFNINIKTNNFDLSNISLENVEALASVEIIYPNGSGSALKECAVGEPSEWSNVVLLCDTCSGASIVVKGDGCCRLY